MWLLKTEGSHDDTVNIELRQFWGNAVQPYAILSHRWSDNPDDEVSFADVKYLARPRPDDDYDKQTILSKPGYRKLIQAMRKAHTDGWQYIWIDTCCIDKDSSVALSEAINSMFRYYQQSAVCYAYLADIVNVADLEKSVYFTRGWTLQELLAPTDLVFTDKDWNVIGTKRSLIDAVSRCTQIRRDYLLKETPVNLASVAERMSWAADRQLSRDEDVAYSLLGLFDVNMYQLYGEGRQRAFQRLQEEILKQIEDQSIFAWHKSASSDRPFPDADTVFRESDYHGLLADGPEDFRGCGGIYPLKNMPDLAPAVMTAKGLRLTLSLSPKTDRLSIATLYCPAMHVSNGLFGLYLLQLDDKPNSYVRVCCDIRIFLYEPGQIKDLYVVQNRVPAPRNILCVFHRLQLRQVRGTHTAGHRIALQVEARGSDTESFSSQPQAFKINKQPDVVSATVRLREFSRHSNYLYPRLAEIRFGAVAGAELTWMILDSHDDGDVLRPRQSGSTISLSWCTITVWLHEGIDGDTKWFTADLEVDAFDSRKPSRQIAESSSTTTVEPSVKCDRPARPGLHWLVHRRRAS